MCPQQCHVLNLETVPCGYKVDLSRDFGLSSPARHRSMRKRLKVGRTRPLLEHQTHQTVIGRKWTLFLLRCQLLEWSVMANQFIHSVIHCGVHVHTQLHNHLRREVYKQKWCVKTAGLALQVSLEVQQWHQHIWVTNSCLPGHKACSTEEDAWLAL